MKVNELKTWRGKIDRVDKGIIKLLAERKRIAENIAKFKFLNGLKIFDKERETSLLEKRIKQSVKLNLHTEFIKSFMQLLMGYSKNAQKKVINSYNSNTSNKNKSKKGAF